VTPTPLAPANRVGETLLEVVAEKTGYPATMLELDMTLDADLGIDSIKRVEILSALQERLPEAPAVKPEHLGTLHTLRQIVEYLQGSDTQASPAVATSAPNRLADVLLEVVAEKTGYPATMLELDMTLDADLGIDSIKRVEILSALQERLPEAPAVKPEHLGTLHTLRQIVDHLADAPAAPVTRVAPAATPGPTSLRRSVLRMAPLPARSRVPLPAGDIVVTADDAELATALARELAGQGHPVRPVPLAQLPHETLPGPVAALVIVAPREGIGSDFLRDALFAVQQHGRGAGRIVTVSRLDGCFGLAGVTPDRKALDGGLAGLTKTVAQEWPGVSARALDIAPDVDAATAAAWLAGELLHTGPLETGLRTSGSGCLELVAEAQPAPAALPIQAGDVVLVSGGARGVTAEVAVALARAARATLVLLGRSPLGEPDPSELANLATEAELKRALLARTPGISPRALGEEVTRILARREVRRTLSRIESAGGRGVYRVVDVRDGGAVTAACQDIARTLGPVRGILHGAGVLADAKLEDKTPAQVEQVFGPKIDGLAHLLAGCDPDALRCVVLFSSTTARVGRRGQVDYAIANEVLNKEGRRLAAALPACRVLSIGWGPWDGGMVSPGLRKVFEQEGVGLIPLEEGANWLVRELGNPGPSPVEVVVLAGLPGAQAPGTPANPGQDLPLAFTRRIDVDSHPVLVGHVLDYRPVLPLALMLEYVGHAAMHQNAGLHFHGCNDLRVLHGITLEDGPRTIELRAGKARKAEGAYLAPVELRSERDGRTLLHARAEVVLVPSLPSAPDGVKRLSLPEYPHSTEEIYRDLLFHGPELVAIEGVEGCGPVGIVARLRPAPAPATWIATPLRPRWLADPLVLDGVFQLMILWSRQQHQSPSLPCRVGKYRQYRRSFPDELIRAQLAIVRQTGAQAFAEVELTTLGGELIARVEDVEVVLDPALQKAFTRNRLPEPARG
jgi:NAD(P)-dependent dehydrogenase (short-subunit alcohol dehydrogenase family)/acyl carrier protein